MPEERLLLSTVGISDYEQTQFVPSEDRVTEAAISPVALTRLLDVDAVLLAHTATVRTETRYLDRVSEACARQGVEVTFVEIPLVEGQENVDHILDRVGAHLTDVAGRAVVLDISHAFRSLQLALYTTVVHLAAVDLAEFDAMYYAEHAGGGDRTPVLDLTYLYTLMEWHHALRSFRTEGTLGPLQSLLTAKRNELYRAGGEDPELARLDSSLRSVSVYLDAGLPLELGVAARNVVETLDQLDDRDFVGKQQPPVECLKYVLDCVVCLGVVTVFVRYA